MRSRMRLSLSLSTLHGRVVGEQTQLRDEMEAMKQNYSQLLQQHSQLQQTCDELRRIHDSDQREVADMRMQQQQVEIAHEIQNMWNVARGG